MTIAHREQSARRLNGYVQLCAGHEPFVVHVAGVIRRRSAIQAAHRRRYTQIAKKWADGNADAGSKFRYLVLLIQGDQFLSLVRKLLRQRSCLRLDHHPPVRRAQTDIDNLHLEDITGHCAFDRYRPSEKMWPWPSLLHLGVHFLHLANGVICFCAHFLEHFGNSANGVDGHGFAGLYSEHRLSISSEESPLHGRWRYMDRVLRECRPSQKSDEQKATSIHNSSRCYLI